MIQVPRAGIKSVNGNLVPEMSEAKPAGDSIQVDIVGTIETGIMAIGGETTGMIVTSGNITWELQVADNMRETAESFNGKQARVKGRLEKKAGVEIAERWIVTIDSIGAPDDDEVCSFESLKIVQSGGFAGISVTSTLLPDGTLTRRDRATNSEKKLNAEALNQIKELLANTDWDRVPQSTRAKNVADDFQFDVTINRGNQSFEFVVDGTKLEEVPVLNKLISWVQ